MKKYAVSKEEHGYVPARPGRSIYDAEKHRAGRTDIWIGTANNRNCALLICRALNEHHERKKRAK